MLMRVPEMHCTTTIKQSEKDTIRLSEYSRIVRVTVRVRVTLRLAVYRQSLRLGAEPLETHNQQFYFPTEHLRL
jgi:hypothetical protein